MNRTIRIILAALILFSPLMSTAGHGGGRCYTYCRPKPVYYPPKPVLAPIHNTTTVQYTYNITQLPAAQGQTAFGLQAQFATYQQADLAIPAMVALADRYAASGVQVTGVAGQAQALAASNQAQALSNNAQALRIAETQVNAATVERVMAAIRPPPQPAPQIYTQQTAVYGQQGYAQPQAQPNGVPPTPTPQPTGDLAAQLAAVHATHCAKCHGSEGAAAAANTKQIPVFGQLNPEQKAAVLGRVFTHDPAQDAQGQRARRPEPRSFHAMGVQPVTPENHSMRAIAILLVSLSLAPAAQAGELALAEVNAARAKRGLPAFVADPGLMIAAEKAAAYRAERLIEGHTPNDFAYVPKGSKATAAGCGAWRPRDGWGTCCTYERHRYAGAAWHTGRNGLRFMHLFVR